MTDIPAGKVPVMDSVQHAFGYLKDSWTKWLPACGVLGLASGWYQVHVVSMASGQANGLTTFGVFCIFMLTSFVFSTAVYRHYFTGEFPQPIGLLLGAEELRVIGAALSVFLVFGIIGAFLFIIFGVAAMTLVASSGIDPSLAQSDPEAFQQAFAAAMGTGPGFVLIFLGLALIALAVFVSVRLIFVTAATVHEKRMMVFQTWSFSKGNFWRIVGAILIVTLPLAIGASILSAIFQAIILGSVDDKALMEAGAASLFAVGFVQGAANAIIAVATVGLVGYLYKGLRPSDEEMEALSKKADS